MIFLSDLHFGDGGPADNFGPAGGVAESALSARIEIWRARKERIGIAGDLLELWKFSKEEVLKAHGFVIEQLLGLADFYVAGNHDEMLLGKSLMGLRVEPYVVFDFHPSPLTLNPSTVRVYAEHGHRHDPLLRRWPRTSAAVVKAAAWAEKLVHRDVDLWAERLISWIGGTGRHGDNERYIPYVASWARAYRCDVAVFGHTHQIMVKDGFGLSVRGKGRSAPLTFNLSPSVAVFNSGTWINGRRDYVQIGGNHP